MTLQTVSQYKQTNFLVSSAPEALFSLGIAVGLDPESAQGDNHVLLVIVAVELATSQPAPVGVEFWPLCPLHCDMAKHPGLVGELGGNSVDNNPTNVFEKSFTLETTYSKKLVMPHNIKSQFVS